MQACIEQPNAVGIGPAVAVLQVLQDLSVLCGAQDREPIRAAAGILVTLQ